MTNLLLAQAEQATSGGVEREGQLRRVVEAAAHEVGVINEPRLHRVAQRHPEHQVAAAAPYIVSDGQRHAEIVGRVARFCWGQKVVHEIDITHERGMPERCVDWVRLSSANKRRWAAATELGDLLPTGLDRISAEGGDATAQRVQDVDWQLPARLGREIGE